MRARLRTTRVAALSAAIALLSACGSFDDSSASGTDADAGLTISLQFTPMANYALETDDAYVLSQVGCLETLVHYDEAAGELKPELATKWTQTKPTSWDFTLRQGVTFQDGTPLTADAVVSALHRVLDAQVPPRAFTPSVISSVEAVDDSTVRITTPKPSSLVPYRVASVNTGILAPDAYTGSGSGTDPLKHCTGPFTPVSEVKKQSMSLERNESYWGGDAALTKVEARFLAEGDTRATQVKTGESQIALSIPSTSIAGSGGDIVVSKAFTPRTSGLYFNNSKAPFDDPDVRKAVQLGIDLDAIASHIYNGTAQPATGPFAADEPWAPEGAEPAVRDVARARSLLKSAGHAPGDIEVTLLAYTERSEFADLAAVLQSQLKEIGIKVSVKTNDYAGIEGSLLDGDYDMALLSRNHLMDIADPIGFFTADYTCEGTYNISHYCDPSFDAEVQKANDEKDPRKRYGMYADLAAKLQEEAVTVHLVHEQTLAARRNNVRNFVDDPLGRYAVTRKLSLG